MVEVNEAYGIGLEQRIYQRAAPGDDDGSFVNAGFPAAIGNIGSYPYADPNYHRETDAPEAVDLENVRLATQACLAAILRVAGAKGSIARGRGKAYRFECEMPRPRRRDR